MQILPKASQIILISLLLLFYQYITWLTCFSLLLIISSDFRFYCRHVKKNRFYNYINQRSYLSVEQLIHDKHIKDGRKKNNDRNAEMKWNEIMQ